MIASLKHNVATLWEALAPYKNQLDIASIGVLLATLFSWIPHVTAIVTLAWSLIRLYETKTVQSWLEKRREGDKA